MSSCENMTVPHQGTRASSGQFYSHWERIFKQEVLPCNAETPIMTKDLSLSSDVWPLSLPRRPQGVCWTSVRTGAVAIDPNGGLSKLTIRVECLIGQKTPQVPVARARGSLVAFWITGRVDIQAGRGQEARGRSTFRVLWEDHRNMLENPLWAWGEGGENRGKAEDKQEGKDGGKPGAHGSASAGELVAEHWGNPLRKIRQSLR